ncbi:hypothetical protein A1O1_01871 [Capronia coronata CBS 617.96]|uniref:Uncharacterized protein n=1 Tax=Capronia coronata CBS 617.96 TaxID=1182541 RepID=W9ZG55_9EURO|nr:uncharacterized protein A1O1_01871 [Capronia coronata CBS 617.96]EXJ93479.1 hypothetical protein A1O1_01871 [Capronia coronata CBS 617.96]
MALLNDPLTDWLLLRTVQPVFAAKVPSIDPKPQAGSVFEEVLWNYETMFEFEMLQASDILPKAEDLALSGDLPEHVVMELRALLILLEQNIDATHIGPLPQQGCALPRLKALQIELWGRHDKLSGSPLDHAHDLSSAVWPDMTLERFRDIIKKLQDFNQSVNRAASSGLRHEQPQFTLASWKEEEIQSVLKAGQAWKSLDRIFERLVDGLSSCRLPHDVMIHLADLDNIKMMLASCSAPRAWRRTICSVVLNQEGGSIDCARTAVKVEKLCTIIGSKRLQELRLICEESTLWHSSGQTVSILKDESRVNLLELLESRTRRSSDPSTAPYLTKKKKKIVAAILAVILLKALGSRWLQKGWESDKIFFFLPDSRPGSTVEFETPYILCSLASELQSGADPLDAPACYSTIFAFGVLLLELELDQGISVTTKDEQEADEEYPPVYMTLLRTFHLREEDLDDQYIQQVIDSCLEFSDRVESIQHPSFGEDLRFRAAIFRYIVDPLIQRLKTAHQDISLDSFGIKPQPQQAPQRQPAQPPMTAPQAPRAQNTFDTSTLPAHRGSPLSHIDANQPTSSFGNGSRATTWSSQPQTLMSRPRTRRDFKIAIICALTLEADAVNAVFDERWDDKEDVYGKAAGDPNAYSTGMVGRHNVVLAHMPGMGPESAARVAANCRISFGGIELALVVGICGASPTTKAGEEIILGDVIISEGIIPYTSGRQYPGQFVRKDSVLDNLGRPNAEIRALLAKLKGRGPRKNLEDNIAKYLASWDTELGGTATYPGVDHDKLYQPRYRHKHQKASSSCATCAACTKPTDSVCEKAPELSCERLSCDQIYLVPRKRLVVSKSEAAPAIRKTDQQQIVHPKVHFGLVASGSIVMKSGEDRDSIAQKENVIAFEMEGAGVWDAFPCLVIKGVCDYADSHKNKSWQNYAAATAATCMKAFLENWTSSTSGM